MLGWMDGGGGSVEWYVSVASHRLIHEHGCGNWQYRMSVGQEGNDGQREQCE